MTMLNRLSSVIGMKTHTPNQEAAAAACVLEPKLLKEIAVGLGGQHPTVIGDCAEVMTKVAQISPLLVVPYIGRLAPLLSHRTTRIRWEAAHAIALAAPYAPHSMFPLLSPLSQLLRTDGSAIVRDYAIDALSGYGATGADAAETVFPPLRDALEAWSGKHCARILEGLARLAPSATSLAPALWQVAAVHANHPKAAVKKAAHILQNSLQ